MPITVAYEYWLIDWRTIKQLTIRPYNDMPTEHVISLEYLTYFIVITLCTAFCQLLLNEYCIVLYKAAPVIIRYSSLAVVRSFISPTTVWLMTIDYLARKVTQMSLRRITIESRQHLLRHNPMPTHSFNRHKVANKCSLYVHLNSSNDS